MHFGCQLCNLCTLHIYHINTIIKIGIYSLQRYCANIRNTVKQETGIPVSIGIGPTKTLAKVANKYAKKRKRDIGVHLLSTPEQIYEALTNTQIGDVWGIGEQYTKFLNKFDIKTAFDFTLSQ